MVEDSYYRSRSRSRQKLLVPMRVAVPPTLAAYAIPKSIIFLVRRRSKGATEENYQE